MCALCGQTLLRTDSDCWHPWNVEVACPPEPPSSDMAAWANWLAANYRTGRPGREHWLPASTYTLHHSVNVYIGYHGRKVHRISSKSNRRHVITTCGLDNRPVRWYDDFKPFRQTTKPVNCTNCLGKVNNDEGRVSGSADGGGILSARSVRAV